MIASMWSTRVGEPISPLIKKEKVSLLHLQKKNVSVQHAGSCNTSKNRKMMIDFRKNMGYYDPRYPALDPTTPQYEFNSYVECCISLNVPGQPSISRFLAYRRYLKEVGVL